MKTIFMKLKKLIKDKNTEISLCLFAFGIIFLIYMLYIKGPSVWLYKDIRFW